MGQDQKVAGHPYFDMMSIKVVDDRTIEETDKKNGKVDGLVFTYKVADDSLTMTNLTGQSYTAKLEGTEAPYKGDPGTTSVSIKKVDKNTMEETDKRDGKVISVARMTLSADGKGMTIAVDDKLHGTTMQFTAQKQ